MTAILEVENLAKHFGGVRAVDGASATIGAGESVAVVGPNGAGKTSLFNLIAGAEQPTAGRIRLKGRDVTGDPAYRRSRLGVMRTFQQLGLMPRETVLDNVLAKLHIRADYPPTDPVFRPWRVKQREAKLRECALEWLEVVGLANRVGSPVHELSFGLARRVEIAAVLAAEPDLLLLDEPTAGLSTSATNELLELLLRLRHSHERTLVLIGHDLGFVLPLADRVIAMDRGKVIAEGTPTEIREDPAVIEAYIGQAPETPTSGPGPRRNRLRARLGPTSRGLAVGDVHAGYALAPVLQGATLAVAPGELSAVVGRNGAGKSTLLKAVHGQLKLKQGWVLWNGRRIEDLPTAARVRAGIAHVPQGRLLFPDFTVRQNMLLAASAAGISGSKTDELLERGLVIFPRLRERADQLAGSMSGGEQQMLALARGLMSDPELLLLDEVSQGLSPRMASEVRDALIGIKQLGIAILAIEHRPWLLEGVADTVHYLERGVIAWSGPLAEAVDRGLLVDVHLGSDDSPQAAVEVGLG